MCGLVWEQLFHYLIILLQTYWVFIVLSAKSSLCSISVRCYALLILLNRPYAIHSKKVKNCLTKDMLIVVVFCINPLFFYYHNLPGSICQVRGEPCDLIYKTHDINLIHEYIKMASGLCSKHIITTISHLKTYSNFAHFTSHYILIHLKYLHTNIKMLKIQV